MKHLILCCIISVIFFATGCPSLLMTPVSHSSQTGMSDGQSGTHSNYVPPYGTYQCTLSTFPGIGTGTIATWYASGWTVNGTTYPGGVSGNYGPIPGGFSWTNGISICQWRYVGP